MTKMRSKNVKNDKILKMHKIHFWGQGRFLEASGRNSASIYGSKASAGTSKCLNIASKGPQSDP